MRKYIAILCLSMIILGALTGCVSGPTPVITSAQTPVETPTEKPFASSDPTNAPAEARDESSRLTFEIEGTQETVDVKLKTGDFTPEGGMPFSVYVDTERYSFLEVEKGGSGTLYYITPGDSLSSDAFVEIQYAAGYTPMGLAGELYGGGNYVDLGKEQFGGNTAFHIDASNDAISINLYIIQTEGGVVAITLGASPENAEGHGSRLLALACSLELG